MKNNKNSQNKTNQTIVKSACEYTGTTYGNCQNCHSSNVCPCYNDTGTGTALVRVKQDGSFVRLG